MEENKYLKLARIAREENNTEDAKKFYDMVRVDDPENIEAKFFYALYNLLDAVNRDVPNKFSDFTKAALSCFSMLEDASMKDEEKIELAKLLADHYLEEVDSIPSYVRSKSYGDAAIYDSGDTSVCHSAVASTLENIGDKLCTLCGGKDELKEIAVECYKKMFNYKSFTGQDWEAKRNEYIAKIKALDPSYEAPKIKKVGPCVIGH